MKYFLDTEFIEEPGRLDLISIGIKCEDGRKLYLISNEYNYDMASEWVKANVIIPMYTSSIHGDRRNNVDAANFHKVVGVSKSEIKKAILDFTDDDESVEFWAYYADYDWVIFCWLFGAMIDLPSGFPMYCRDLKQSLDESNKECIKSPTGEHNAIVDAEWNEKLYNHILNG